MLLLKQRLQLPPVQHVLLVLIELQHQSIIIALVCKDLLKELFNLKIARPVISLVIDALDQMLINVLIVIWLATELQQLREPVSVCQDSLILDSLIV